MNTICTKIDILYVCRPKKQFKTLVKENVGFNNVGFLASFGNIRHMVPL